MPTAHDQPMPVPPRRPLARTLPGRMLRIIDDGAHPADLARDGDRAVWSALVTTAMSAVVRGQDRMEWQALIERSTSNLFRQVSTRKGLPRPKLAVQKTLAAAWDKAWVLVSEKPTAWDAEEAAQEAQKRASALRTAVADADVPLTDAERRVLAHAADEAEARGLTRIALPRRAVSDATGLGERATRTAMTSIVDNGWIELAERGRSGGPKTRERAANLYQLVTPERMVHLAAAPARSSPTKCRETRPVGPHPLPVGPLGPDTAGTPALPVGLHSSQQLPKSARPVRGGFSIIDGGKR